MDVEVHHDPRAGQNESSETYSIIGVDNLEQRPVARLNMHVIDPPLWFSRQLPFPSPPLNGQDNPKIFFLDIKYSNSTRALCVRITPQNPQGSPGFTFAALLHYCILCAFTPLGGLRSSQSGWLCSLYAHDAAVVSLCKNCFVLFPLDTSINEVHLATFRVTPFGL